MGIQPNETPPPPVSGKFLYACITCLQPNQALYKQYSTAKNIKLQTCAICCRDVDPYIERELLLVVMDMMLLRDCAYRHLFFNRSHAYQEKSKLSGHGDGGMYSLKNGILSSAVCVLLRVLLKMQGSKHSSGEPFQQLLPLLHSSVVQFAALWMGTMLTAYFCQKMSIVNSSKSTQLSILEPMFWKQMHLAIIIPQLFHFVTLFVHIYENSLMIRLLGSIFVSCFSHMAICTVMERHYFQPVRYESDVKIHSQEKKISNMISSMPFLVGLGIELSTSIWESEAALSVPTNFDDCVEYIRSIAN
jgi:hypothetical protein